MHVLIAYISQRIPFYYGWIVLGAAGSSMFVRNAVGSLTFAVFLPIIVDETGWSRALVGGAAAVGGLLATGASPLVGWAIDRYGARLVLVLSLIIIGLSTIAMAWLSVHIAVFYTALAVGRIMFSSPLNLGASTMVARWFVRRRGPATGLLFLSHSSGMVVFPLVATWVSMAYGWQTAWVVLGLMVYVIALAPAALLVTQRPEDVGLLPDGDEAKSKHAGAAGPAAAGKAVVEIEWTTRQAVRTPALWVLAVGTGVLFLLQSGTNVYQADLLRSRAFPVPDQRRCQRCWNGTRQPPVGSSPGENERVPHLRDCRAIDGGCLRSVRQGKHCDAGIPGRGFVRRRRGRHPGRAFGGVRQLLWSAVPGHHTRGNGAVHFTGASYRSSSIRLGFPVGRRVWYRFRYLRRVGGGCRYGCPHCESASAPRNAIILGARSIRLIGRSVPFQQSSCI